MGSNKSLKNKLMSYCNMKYSVIIPTYNEEKEIARAIASAAPAEVIVVDAGSRDKTVSIAKKYKAKVIQTKKKSKAYQLNQGSQQAKGDVLLFLHADCRLPKHWQKHISRKDQWGGFFLQYDNKDIFFRLVECRSNWMRVMLSHIFLQLHQDPYLTYVEIRPENSAQLYFFPIMAYLLT